MSDGFHQWTCAYCGRDTLLTPPCYDQDSIKIDVERSEHGPDIGLFYTAIACPNPDCRKLQLTVRLSIVGYRSGVLAEKGELHAWDVLPESSAKPQPDYIPEALRVDYVEACRISALSPKASATLSRRCLQGMIRDFWRTSKKPNLKQEIEAIRDKVDPGTWAAIDAVRSVGNIGAHMEQDINLVVEVDPKEADLLLGLIETLFKEWYVGRFERESRMNALVELATKKDAARKGRSEEAGNSPSSSGEPS